MTRTWARMWSANTAETHLAILACNVALFEHLAREDMHRDIGVAEHPRRVVHALDAPEPVVGDTVAQPCVRSQVGQMVRIDVDVGQFAVALALVLQPLQIAYLLALK